MPNSSEADTIRILVSTDNHVGYNESDPTRGDDSWKTFHEIMTLAKERDVDMILLAGDLFHENKPSRKAMYQVMRSLRMNCYGEKPCELEFLSDASETFNGAFNHANYEDPDINVAIPVFSIHGNHDDPTGPGNFAALDLLQMSGLLNYYGRVPESDNIQIKPVLLQKGHTKLALYGMSNVRDERMFRTFRDGNVKFFQPGQQKDDWFNLMSVHQNHHAYTETGYLPENFLPSFLDLVIWGHEHECLIEPRTNTETNFRVSQPGSSVATSLVPGEAVPKYVGLLSVTGKEFDMEPIRLKTVRPFKFKEIALADDKGMKKIAHDHENITKVHRHLVGIVEAMIEEAKDEWMELQREFGEELEEDVEPPLPLIRLRVEYTAPEGGKFDIDNPQRFSARFVGRVANVTDVVQYYRKKKATSSRKSKNQPEMPDEATMSRDNFETIKVEKLVEEFLTAQSLTILPQNNFSDAVTQFVDKDDRQAMLEFVETSLKHLVTQVIEDRDAEDPDQDIDDDQMFEVIAQGQARLEEAFRRGEMKRTGRKGSRKAKPDEWDSDLDGHWEDNVASIIRSEDEGGNDDDDDDAESVASRPTTAHGRGRGRGGKAAAGTTRKTAAATKKAPAKSTGRGKKKQVSEDQEEEDSDVVMIDDNDDDDDDESLFVRPAAKKAPAIKATTSRATAAKTNGTSAKTSSTRGGKSATGGTQSQLSFGRQTSGTGAGARANGTSRAAAPKRLQEPSEDEISDDDDAFEPPPPSARAEPRKR